MLQEKKWGTFIRLYLEKLEGKENPGSLIEAFLVGIMVIVIFLNVSFIVLNVYIIKNWQRPD